MTGGAFTPEAQMFLDEMPNLRLDKPFDRKTLLEVLERCVVLWGKARPLEGARLLAG